MRIHKKIVAILLILFIIGELVYLLYDNALVPVSKEQLQIYASSVIKKCENAKLRQTCYDKEIPQLMSRISMEEAFKVTSIVQDNDKEFAYCHVLGHNLSAREVKKDPNKWKDVLTRCPSGECSNGCLHGGLQERYRAESLTNEQVKKLIPELSAICMPRDGWTPTGLEQSSCIHAVGHLAMYMTSADIKGALNVCDKVVLGSQSHLKQICYDGVFMQIFQPLDPEDFALVKDIAPTKDTVDALCNVYEGKEKASCHTESWPLFRDEIMNPATVDDFCERADESERDRCFDTEFFIVATQFKLDFEKMYDYCSNVVEQRRPKCFANAAARLIEVDWDNIPKSLNMCEHANVYDSDGICFQELIKYSTFNFHPGSDENIRICKGMPKKWQNICLRISND